MTHRAPGDPTRAAELPAAVKRRLGLDEAASWIIAEEVNRFVWPGPDLRDESGIDFDNGSLPEDVFDELRARMLALNRAGDVQLMLEIRSGGTQRTVRLVGGTSRLDS
jgi:hypothetical protein